MSDKNHFVELDDFGYEVVSRLQIHLFDFDVDALIHVLIVDLRDDNAGEQVAGDTFEKW